MTQNPGDRKYGHGDVYTAQNPDENVNAGDFVEISAEGEVTQSGTELYGVAQEGWDDGAYDQGTVETAVRGIVWAHVAQSTSAGDILTGVAAGEGDASGSSTVEHYVITDAVQLDDGEGGTTSEYYALVLLR
jgi:hypothetical protein